MLGAVVDHVAPLTERGEVGPGVVGRVVVAVGRSQDHAGPAHAPEDVHGSGREAYAPPASVPPGRSLPVPPAAIAEVDHTPPMRSAATLAAPSRPVEPDHPGELRPVDRVEEGVRT